MVKDAICVGRDAVTVFC